MRHDDMLGRLVGEAERGGTDLVTMRAIIEEASELGAERALTRLGLADERARGDIEDLRELLGAWRSAKRGAWKAGLEWLMRALLALLLIGIAVRLGLPGLLR